MRELGIDIETYSSEDLKKCGVYRYVEAPDFAVLLFAYSWDGAPAATVDLAQGEELPAEILSALTDPEVVKTAFNAAFERVCLSKWLGAPLDVRQWRCTMVRAARMGLPLSLGQCAEVLGLAEGKMAEGAALIRLFSKPAPRTGKRVMPADRPDKWETFKLYNVRDVDVEQAVLRKVRRLEVPAFDEELWVADQRINDRGVLIDPVLVANAERFDQTYKARLLDEAKALTGLENPNSVTQLKAWLHDVTGVRVETINKTSIEDLEDRLKHFRKASRMLAIRRELGKTSCSKYTAMEECVCADGRIRGLLQFCGAARTGRWAGRLVQVQNLPQNHLESLDDARRLVRDGDYDEFTLSYDKVTPVLSELIRTAFVAAPGKTFHVCDFSAIEARVIAWFAGEKWVLDVFRSGGDIYCATASQMFGVPVEKHGRNAELRQKGKIAVLALGYGGGVTALEKMGGSRLGLSEQEETEIVALWRRSNPHIKELWSKVERAAMCAIRNPGTTYTANRGLEFSYRWRALLVKLPSGRTMGYPRVRIESETMTGRTGDFEKESIVYEGLNQTTKKWEDDIRTYGGKMVENIVQATARDILGEVILRAEAAGLPIVFHIHDEIVVEAGPGQTLQQVEDLFSEPIPWCADLPLKGAGYTTPYYKKD